MYLMRLRTRIRDVARARGFTAAEVKNPKRDVALAMAFGTLIVTTLYCFANLAYLCTMTLHQIQTAPDDRVATAALSAISFRTNASNSAVVIGIVLPPSAMILSATSFTFKAA